MNASESLKIIESLLGKEFACDYLNPQKENCEGCILYTWPDKKEKGCHKRTMGNKQVNPEAIEYIKILARKEKLEKLLSQ